MRIGIIGGSGVGDRLVERMRRDGAPMECVRPRTPFGEASDEIVLGEVGDVSVALLARHGPGHAHPPHSVPYRANIFALKSLGVTHVVATGAVGSLREHIQPGHVVVCDQLIDRTINRPRTFFDEVAVHVEFADPFCPVMRKWLIDAADPDQIHDAGTYVCMEGPAFSTRAESAMHRDMGADIVGMTAMPEARLAREAEMAYALLALPTDYDCWRPRDPDADELSLLHEIKANLDHAAEAAFNAIEGALADARPLNAPSPAHDALKHAVWSRRDKVHRATIARLGPLWGRYFD